MLLIVVIILFKVLSRLYDYFYRKKMIDMML